MKYFKPNKRLGRKELIAQTERRRLTNRFKKEKTKLMKQDAIIKSGSTSKQTEAIARPRTSGQEEQNNNNNNNSKKPYLTANKKALLEFEAKKKEKQERLEEEKKRREAREAAMAAHKKNRKTKYRDLCKRTRSGQILMGKQIDTLINKIQNKK